MNFLSKLLIPYGSIKYNSLKEEQKMCVEFANEMRRLTFANQLPYVWFHITNEFLPSKRINYSFELKQKHMGKVSGAADYCFIGKNDSFFIEFKSGKIKQTDNQKYFEEWCASNTVDYYLCRSAEEGRYYVNQRIGIR